MASTSAPQEECLYLRREDRPELVVVDLFDRRLHVTSTAQALEVSVLSIQPAPGDHFVVVTADHEGYSIKPFKPNKDECPLLVQARTAAAGANYLSGNARVELLLRTFGERLRRCMKRLPQLVSDRKRTPVIGTHPERAEIVESIGSYFAVQGLTRPALQLLHALYYMDQHFRRPLGRGLKWEESVQLCRLIAAPGMGKSTALDLLCEELRQLVAQHGTILQELWADNALASRVRNSLKEDSMLVFKMDLSSLHGLNCLTPREETLAVQNMLAARLLYMATCDATASPTSHYYSAFLNELDNILPLQQLYPLDVLRFIKAASGLGPDDEGLVVFAFDEVNAVQQKAGQKTTWFQEALAAFVVMRFEASNDKALKLMPVAITASTVASATTLKSTSIWRSQVADLYLVPLTLGQMWAVVQDLCLRLGHDLQGLGREGQPYPAHVTQVLKFVGGNPRHLAWAISAMSGCRPPDMRAQVLFQGKGHNVPWVCNDKAFDMLDLLDRLASMFQSWDTWLSSAGSKHILFTQLLVHGLLGRHVSRADKVPHTTLTWQDAESCGACMLVNYGTLWGQQLGCPNSRGGWAADKAGTEQWLRKHLGEAVLHLTSEDTDAAIKHEVYLPPMLGVLGMRHASISLAQPPLTAKLADEWRDREYSDVMMLVLRLQLLSIEASLLPGGRDTTPLSELLPGELPSECDDVQIKLPGANWRLTDVPVPTEQLSASKFEQLCTSASYDGDFAFVGPGNHGPDGWLVLQLANGGQFIVVVQSKKKATSRQTTLADVATEARKCWEVPVQQLLVLVTDNKTDNLDSPVTDTQLPVVAVGPLAHQRFYTPAGAFVKACLAAARVGASKKRCMR